MEHARPPAELSLEGGPASRAEAWRKWHKQFVVFLKASGVHKETPDVQASLLINLIGPEGYDVYTTFKFDNEADRENLDTLVSKFNEHFGTKQNTTMARFKFFTRNQDIGESIDEYVTALKLLTQQCQFEHLEEGLIRDRIVCGVTDGKLRDRLLRADDLTLARAVKICQANEMSTEEKRQIEGIKADNDGGASHVAVDAVYGAYRRNGGGAGRAGAGGHWSRGRGGGRQMNWRFGSRGGARAMSGTAPNNKRLCQACFRVQCDGGYRCPARGAQCFGCGERGHFKSVCPKLNSDVCQLEEVSSDDQELYFVSVVDSLQGDNLSCFTHGCSTGWVSGVLGNEALTGGAWLAALPCLVALPAAPFFAVLADAKGRKAGAFCISISFIISWSLAAWGGPRGVWAARAAAGAGGAGALALAPLYCAEIAPRTRGLAAMPALACSSGILFAYGAGGILSAHALSLSMAVPPAVLLVSLLWLQETPSFLISIGKIQDAAKVICWFDGSDFQEDLTDVIEQQEVRIRTSADCYGRREAMRRQDSDAFQPMLKRSSGLDSNSDRKSEPSACRDLFRHRRSRRAIFSCFMLLCAAAGSGAGAVNSFAAAVLRHSTHSVPRLNVTAYNFTLYNGTVPRSLFDTSEAGSLLCGIALVLGAAVATIGVDKLGRKMLLLWSCSGITCCLALLGVYCDPRIRVLSWYSHRLWPYKKMNNIQEKNIHNDIDNIHDIDLNIQYENFTNDVLKNYTNETKLWVKVDMDGDNFTNWSTKLPNMTDTKVLMIEQNDDATVWTPVMLLSAVLFLYNIGLGSVPYVLISELFSINVRSLASSLLISWIWLSNFLLLRYYGTAAVSLGLHNTYYISASITLMGSLYTFFIIPETKGRSQEEIEEALDGPLLVLKKRKNQR